MVGSSVSVTVSMGVTKHPTRRGTFTGTGRNLVRTGDMGGLISILKLVWISVWSRYSIYCCRRKQLEWGDNWTLFFFLVLMLRGLGALGEVPQKTKNN